MLCDFPRVFSQVAAIAVTLFAGLFEPPLSTFQDIRLATGVRLRVAQQGPKDGPVVLLLHGYSDSSFSFSRLMPFLPAHVRVIAAISAGTGIPSARKVATPSTRSQAMRSR